MKEWNANVSRLRARVLCACGADTIPGRQCMASCFFLLRQFEDVLIYLNSIKARTRTRTRSKRTSSNYMCTYISTIHYTCPMFVCAQSYFFSDDVFNLNYAQAKASVGQYHEAEECFLLVQSERLRRTYVFISWLARCCAHTIRCSTLQLTIELLQSGLVLVRADIMNQKPAKAWELYLKMETSADSYSLLQLIANDCYRVSIALASRRLVSHHRLTSQCYCTPSADGTVLLRGEGVRHSRAHRPESRLLGGQTRRHLRHLPDGARRPRRQVRRAAHCRLCAHSH